MVNEKLIDITGLSRYHDNLKVVLETKANEAAAATAQALTDAKAHADALVKDEEGNLLFDTVGSAAAAQSAAEATAAADATSKANAAQAAAEATAAADATAKANAAQSAAEATASADATSKANAAKDAAIDAAATDATTKANAAQSAAEATASADATSKANAAQAAAEATAAADATKKADDALSAAKEYADGLDADMDERVAKLEAIDHEKLASDASAAAVATVLDGAPDKFDTLKEVAQWITDSESAATAADLVTRVKALEDIDHDAYVEADKTVLADAKTYADGLVMVDGVDKFDAAGTAASAAAQALADAKADAAEKYQVKGDYATVGQVNAKQDAITDLQTIRDGAALGATALQAVPEEYVTETELTGKGYLTANDFGFATDGDIDALFEIQ